MRKGEVTLKAVKMSRLIQENQRLSSGEQILSPGKSKGVTSNSFHLHENGEFATSGEVILQKTGGKGTGAHGLDDPSPKLKIITTQIPQSLLITSST